MKRREALGAAAAAGLLVWVAPTITSTTVQAHEPSTTCTPKCAPVGGASVCGTAVAEDCSDGPPGLQNVLARITSVTPGDGTCPCGGTAAVVILNPVPGGDLFEVRPKPGNLNQGEFDIDLTIECTDRSGDITQVSCWGNAVADIKPGSCQGVKGRSFEWCVTPYCGSPVCNPRRIV